MALIYVFIASLLAAIVNFCLRKNAEQQKSAQGYLTLYFTSSFLISFFLAEATIDNFRFVIPSVGAIAGILNFMMMGLLSLALHIGPSGLTFSFQNSASIFPSLSLFLIFGSPLGFNMNYFILIGFCLLVAGLFLAARIQNNSTWPRATYVKWLLLVIAIFCIQGVILSLFQWRCLLLLDNVQDHPLIPWKCAIQEDAWFMPGFFFIPTILQLFIFGFYERRWPSFRESFLGLMGGLFNGGATCFLLMATQQANPNEKMILFPLFAVCVICLCNLWGKALYDERIYWPGMLLCLAGVFIGSLPS